MKEEISRIHIPYGHDGNNRLKIAIPNANLMGVYTPLDIGKFMPEEQLIKEALENPIGTEELSAMVEPGMKVVIIADDITRPTPVSKIIPLILSKLSARGIPDYQISIVFALGTHTPMSEDQRKKRAGISAERIGVFNSEFKDPQGIVDYGETLDGVHVLVDKRVAEADFRIGIGSILPHPECGWGGGAKIIYPGVASEQTVTQFHLSYASVDWNTYGSDKAPVRLNMEKWVDTVGLDFIVNSVVTPDDRVYRVVAGDYIKAHRMGIKYAREIYSVTLPHRADIVVITSFRADEDFWLASKAIFAGELIIKDHGTLILVCPCPEGVGPHPEYADYIGRDDWKDLLKDTINGKINQPIAVSAAVALAKMRKRFDISIVSDGLTVHEVKKMKYQHFISADHAIKAAIEKHGKNAKIAVLPYGISTVPEMKIKDT